MRLRDLADACRESGLRVVETPGWAERGHGEMASVSGVVCHWTATPENVSPSDPMPTLTWLIQGGPQLPGPCANLGLGRDGAVFLVAAGVAWHAGEGTWPAIPTNQGNYHLIGIECESAGTFTPAQLDAYPRLCAALARHYRFPVKNIMGHHEWAPGRKIDIRTWPGGMNAFRNTVSDINKPPPQHRERKGLEDMSPVVFPPGQNATSCMSIPSVTGSLSVAEAYLNMGIGYGDATIHEVTFVSFGGTNPRYQGGRGEFVLRMDWPISMPVPKDVALISFRYSSPRPWSACIDARRP